MGPEPALTGGRVVGVGVVDERCPVTGGISKGSRQNKFTFAMGNVDIIPSGQFDQSRQNRTQVRVVLGPWIASDSAPTTERNRRRP